MADDTNAQVLIKLSAIDNLTPVMLKALASMQENSSKMAEALDQVSKGSESAGAASESASEEHAHQALSFIALKEAAEVVYEAYEKLEAQFDRAIEEALAGEAATNKLNGALVSTGQYTPEASEEIEKYADALAKATGANVETTKSIIGSGLQMGLSIPQAEGLQQAAQKLALQMGGDTAGAAKMLESSLAGQSRGLAKLFPQIKDMTTGQLMHGDAIALVSKALDAQYQLYQGSFAQGLEKAKTSINEVYKEFGNIIINSPLAKDAVNLFAEVMNDVAEAVKKAGEYLKDHTAQIEAFASSALKVAEIVGAITAAFIIGNTVIPFAIAVYGALTTSVSLYGVAGTVAANATALLEGAIALLTAPVSLVIIGIVALTAALYKWPGLFDILIGGIKSFIGVAIFPMTAALAALTLGIGATVSIFNKDWGASITNAAKSMLEMNANLVKSGVAQIQMGAASISAGKQVEDSAAAAKKATQDKMKADSDAAAASLAAQKVYDGFTYGTLKQRQELTNQVGDRDKDLKDFTAYLDNKERLAIKAADEQVMAVNAIQAKALSGSGAAGKSADAQVAIDNEIKKQAALDVLRQKGAVSKDQYNQASLASDQRADRAELVQAQAAQDELNTILGLTPAGVAGKLALLQQQQNLQLAQMKQSAVAAGASAQQVQQQELAMKQQFYTQKLSAEKQFDQQQVALATAQQKQIATLLGETPAGLQARQQLKQKEFQMELQQRKQHATQEGLNQKQISDMEAQANREHLAAMELDNEKFFNDKATLDDQLGDHWAAMLDRVQAAYVKNGSALDAAQAVLSDKQVKGVQGSLSTISSLQSSHNSALFEVGKQAAAANAAINVAQGFTAALALGPILGPILGAGVLIAGAVQIADIESQQPPAAAKADSGMTSVPNNLDGKSFILSQGERVVQPTANTDLTDFLAKQKTGGATAGAGQTIQINLTYSGAMSKDDVKQMADMLVKEIRDRSNRGQPIMSQKGITK